MEVNYYKHIGIYKNSISNEICNKLIEIYEQNSKFHHQRDSEAFIRDNFLYLEDIVNNNKNLKEKEELIKVINSFNTTLENSLKKYKYKYPYLSSYKDICPLGGYKLQKTLPTEGFHNFHIEQSCESLDYFSRVLVYTLYLNDVEEGGETEFLEQLTRIKPEKGTLCIFPAGFTHPHRGNTPFSGKKYILTGWLCSKTIIDDTIDKLRDR